MKDGFGQLATAVLYMHIMEMLFAAVELVQAYQTQDEEQIEQARKWLDALVSKESLDVVLSLAFELDDYERQLIEQRNESLQAAQ